MFFTSLACVSVIALTFWQIWTARQNTLDDAQTAALNLSNALNTYTDAVFRQSELVLADLSERIEQDGSDGLQLERLRSVIAQQMKIFEQLNGITMFNEKGNVVFSSYGSLGQGINSVDQAYFVHHREHADRNTLIGPAIISRFTGNWVITVSRRLELPDSSFAGVIVVTINLEQFLELYRNIEIGQSGVISMASASGRILARYPFQQQDLGRDVSSAPIFSKTMSDISSGIVVFDSRSDGVRRRYAFKKSNIYPIVTTVALGEEETMRVWRNQSKHSLLVLVILLALIATLGWRLIKHIKSRIKAEDKLRLIQTSLIESNQALEVLAMEDKLTGLANRRQFDLYLDIELNRAHRIQSPLSLLLIDVDYFKRFNDQYGHIAGDECLQVLCARIKQCVRRPSDMVARYGGEELAVVMPNTDESGASLVAESIMSAISQMQIKHVASPMGVITVSVGLATYKHFGSEWGGKDLVKHADDALYSAKQGGRNRFNVAVIDS